MTFVHSTNVYVWKERLFGKPSFKPSRLSLYDNGRIQWDKDESGTQKGSANLKDIFSQIRLSVLDNEAKKERAKDEGLILAYHTLILPLEITKAGVATGFQEREFALAFEREIFDWMHAIARVSRTIDRFQDVVRKYRLRKNFNAYSGSSNYGLSQLGEKVDVVDGVEADEDDTARLWSAARGSNEDYITIWANYQEQAVADMMSASAMSNGYSCVKCW